MYLDLKNKDKPLDKPINKICIPILSLPTYNFK